MYLTAVIPVVMHCLDTMGLIRRHEANFTLRKLRLAIGVTMIDKIRIKYIRGMAGVEMYGVKRREEVMEML